MRHFRSHTFLLLVAFVSTGVGACDWFGDTPCEPACDEGLICDGDQGRCIPPPLSPIDTFDDGAPGRSVQIAATDNQSYVAAIDPDRQLLLIGHLEGGEVAFYELASRDERHSEQIALAATDSAVVAAWLDADRRYHLAVHRSSEDPERWHKLGPIEPDEGDYRGSDHFDVELTADEKIHLVFQDRQSRTLAYLSGRIDGSRWGLETIDDAGEEDGETICSNRRREEAGRGVGQFPDASVETGALFVAYRDGDCGDLRLARRLDRDWVVSVVDTGDFDAADSENLRRGSTGKFPSIGFDGEGRLGIAYQDTSRGQLRFAIEKNGHFDIEIADEGSRVDDYARRRQHLVGGFANLAFDDDDIPFVAYMDTTTTRLRLAGRNRGLDRDPNWTRRMLCERAPCGFSAGLVWTEDHGLVAAAEYLSLDSSDSSSRLFLVTEDDF